MLYNVKIHAKKRGVPPKNRSYLLHTVCYSYLCVLYVTIVSGYDWWHLMKGLPINPLHSGLVKLYQLLLYKTFAGMYPVNFLIILIGNPQRKLFLCDSIY